MVQHLIVAIIFVFFTKKNHLLLEIPNCDVTLSDIGIDIGFTQLIDIVILMNVFYATLYFYMSIYK